jgi:hypothetical protein
VKIWVNFGGVFGSTGVWTQGLALEPFCWPPFCFVLLCFVFKRRTGYPAVGLWKSSTQPEQSWMIECSVTSLSEVKYECERILQFSCFLPSVLGEVPTNTTPTGQGSAMGGDLDCPGTGRSQAYIFSLCKTDTEEWPFTLFPPRWAESQMKRSSQPKGLSLSPGHSLLCSCQCHCLLSGNCQQLWQCPGKEHYGNNAIVMCHSCPAVNKMSKSYFLWIKTKPIMFHGLCYFRTFCDNFPAWTISAVFHCYLEKLDLNQTRGSWEDSV